MSQTSLSSNRIPLSLFRKLKLKTKIREDKNILRWQIFCFLLLIFLLFIHLVQVNQLSLSGFTLKELEKRIEYLERNNRLLEIQAADLEANFNTYQRVKKLNMIQMENVSYIRIPSSFAVK